MGPTSTSMQAQQQAALEAAEKAKEKERKKKQAKKEKKEEKKRTSTLKSGDAAAAAEVSAAMGAKRTAEQERASGLSVERSKHKGSVAALVGRPDLAVPSDESIDSELEELEVGAEEDEEEIEEESDNTMLFVGAGILVVGALAVFAATRKK